jgi:UDP-N-acetyl-D-glucosamine/UDP-N-acetyl-D-galactosamine dehydrogenase
MAIYVAGQIVKLMTHKRIHINGSRVLVLGLTFKENCPDIRNSKVVDVIRELQKYGAAVDVHDPWVDAAQAKHEYGIRLVRSLVPRRYDVVVVAVAHRQFRELGAGALRALCRRNHVLYDVKYIFGANEVDGRL